MAYKLFFFLLFLTLHFLDIVSAKNGKKKDVLIYSKPQLSEMFTNLSVMFKNLEMKMLQMEEYMLSASINIEKLQRETVANLDDRVTQLERANEQWQAEMVGQKDRLLRQPTNGNNCAETSTKEVPKQKREKEEKMQLRRSLSVPAHFSQKLFHNKSSKYDSDQLGTIISQVHMAEGVNIWDANACHAGLAISGTNRLVVENRATECGSIFAKWDISKYNPAGIFYYEVTLINGSVSIGLARKTSKLTQWIGYARDSYGYSTGGHILCNGKTMGNNFPQYKSGYTVGCGVNLITKKLAFSLNGKVLDTKDLAVSSTENLYPCVTLLRPNSQIEANFGPNFDFDTIFATLEQTNNLGENLESPTASPSSVETIAN